VHRPGLPWSLLRSVWWNRYPDRKPLWYAEGSHDDVPFGLPVLENEKALLARRYFLNPAVEKRMIDFAAREGDGFFARAGWFDRYREAYRDACTELGDRAGAWESEAERLSRITDELRRSREEIGKRLEKDVRFLCCPGGSLNSEVFTIAREVGYDAVSIPSWFERGWNRPGGDAARFYRTGTGSLFRRVRSDRADALSTAVHVGAILGRPGDRFAWVALRAARRLRLI
jgi:hypothetical protein